MSAEPSVVVVEDADGVRTLTLDRPDSLNTLNRQVARELSEALRAAERDASVRVLVLTGRGRAFCAGQDLKDLEALRQPDGRPALGGLLRDHYNPLVKRLATIDKPVVAAINGAAAGAGLSLALACDLRIASDQATFVTAFSAIGLVPDSGALYTLPRLVGWAKAAELCLTSDRLSAADALRLGLVNQVVPADDLPAATASLVGRLARGPALAYSLLKRGLRRSATADLDTVLELEAQYQQIAGRSDDFREGLEAFVAKRTPTFRGS